eukprot:TRINITY_DN66325_c6_g12_i1.p1 TRINITY_DN66325_c6_g12~~TRINITY_DN66325_c6_g12_i1.p1  ORF type:complete len:774 (-),score=335.10 TRINITY_DN66325_c6_g12_i1:17-2299(-)
MTTAELGRRRRLYRLRIAVFLICLVTNTELFRVHARTTETWYHTRIVHEATHVSNSPTPWNRQEPIHSRVVVVTHCFDRDVVVRVADKNAWSLAALAAMTRERQHALLAGSAQLLCPTFAASSLDDRSPTHMQLYVDHDVASTCKHHVNARLVLPPSARSDAAFHDAFTDGTFWQQCVFEVNAHHGDHPAVPFWSFENNSNDDNNSASNNTETMVIPAEPSPLRPAPTASSSDDATAHRVRAWSDASTYVARAPSYYHTDLPHHVLGHMDRMNDTMVHEWTAETLAQDERQQQHSNESVSLPDELDETVSFVEKSFKMHYGRVHVTDKTAKAKERDQIHNSIVLMQLTSKLRTLDMARTSHRTIWELLVRPIIIIVKDFIQQGAQAILTMALVAFLAAFLGELISKFPAPPGSEPAPKLEPVESEAKASDEYKSDDDVSSLLQTEFNARAGGRGNAFIDTFAEQQARLREHLKQSEVHELTDEHLAFTEEFARGMTRTATREMARTKSTDVESIKAESMARFEVQMKALVKQRAQSKFVTKPIVEAVVPKVLDMAKQAILDMGENELLHTLSLWLTDSLKEQVNTTVAREVTIATTTTLVYELSHAVVDLVAEILTISLSTLITTHVARVCLPQLTWALTHTIAYSMTRSPISDYYCWFCAHHGLYCSYCRHAFMQDYNLGYYLHHYTRYYNRYYTYYYSGYYARVFANKMLRPWYWTGAWALHHEPEPAQKCFDDTNDECIRTDLTPNQNYLSPGKKDH